MDPQSFRIAVIGLGYVGLPLAVEFGKKYHTVGFDINTRRIEELKCGRDKTLELSEEQIKNSTNLHFTIELDDIKSCNYYIITVPTPINENRQPDLIALIKASETVGKVLKRGDIIIYESTVYPGVTEDECASVLENVSGLVFNRDFFCGYSPERINPGDKEHTLQHVVKVTSGSTKEVAQKVDQLYKSIIPAGTHLTPSIKVAEAAKVIENAQRDINIAFVNELAIIFAKLGIPTKDVLEAAGTKWNFLPFKPGLVGGHCIGVDPYYLAYKAQTMGYHPEIILAGRRLNDNMSVFVANQVIKLMIKKGHKISGSKVLILGITFKENCPDIRNSKVIDIINEFKEFGCNVEVYDPWADEGEVMQVYGIKVLGDISVEAERKYDSIVVAVAHDKFRSIDLLPLKKDVNSVLFDLKGILDGVDIDGTL